MTIIESYILQMREESKTLRDMCSLYPGDPLDNMQTEAYLLDLAASWLERRDWSNEEKLFRRSLPKLTITYSNDNPKEPL